MFSHGPSEKTGSNGIRGRNRIAQGYSGDKLPGFIPSAVNRVNTEFPKAIERLEKARANELSPEQQLSREPICEVIEISVDAPVRFTARQLKPYFASHFHSILQDWGFAFHTTRSEARTLKGKTRLKCVVIFQRKVRQ